MDPTGRRFWRWYYRLRTAQRLIWGCGLYFALLSAICAYRAEWGFAVLCVAESLGVAGVGLSLRGMTEGIDAWYRREIDPPGRVRPALQPARTPVRVDLWKNGDCRPGAAR